MTTLSKGFRELMRVYALRWRKNRVSAELKAAVRYRNIANSL